jgi:hypothetical protein
MVTIKSLTEMLINGQNEIVSVLLALNGPIYVEAISVGKCPFHILVMQHFICGGEWCLEWRGYTKNHEVCIPLECVVCVVCGGVWCGVVCVVWCGVCGVWCVMCDV